MLKCNIDQAWAFARVPILLLNKPMINGSAADLRKKDFLNPDELAEYLGISKPTVYRLIEKRQIPFIKLGGSIRFNMKVMDSFLKSIGTEPFKK